MAVLQLCLLALFVAGTKSSYVFSNTIVIDSGNFNVSYNFNESADALEFLVKVKATGWISFGFALSPSNMMVGYDVAVGGVLSNGTGYIQDYLTTGRPSAGVGPPLDSQQDWMLTNSSEQNGVTTLKFYRLRNTTDEKDIAIEQGMSVYLIWGYHSSSDVEPGQFEKHTSRGALEVTLIPAAATTSSPVITTAPTNQLVHFAKFMSFNNGNFKASWMFNSSMDTLHFMVEVKATGWIGFGFATEAPNRMVGYDVAIGGVMSGSGYLTDHLTNGYGRPPQDSQQDWMLSYSREENDVTILRFYRKRDTNDLNDVAIQQGKSVFLILAYHSTSDAQPNQFMQHSFRHFQEVILIPEIPQFTHSFDNDRFLLYWRYDRQADKMVFRVKVKTTGWVGFGFAKEAPNSMNNYDVIVGGSSNGQGYLYDYYTQGRRQPLPDVSQDYTLLSASERGGYTELTFERARDTKDINDLTFTPGEELHLIWAYGDMDIIDSRTYNRHSNRGFTAPMVIIQEQPIPTEAAAPALHASICGIVSLTIAFFLNVLLMSI